MQGEFYPSSSLHTIRISQDLYSSEAEENKSRLDALKWICGSGDGWEGTVYEDMSLKVGPASGSVQRHVFFYWAGPAGGRPM